jgi:FkbM family methyltransferase
MTTGNACEPAKEAVCRPELAEGIFKYPGGELLFRLFKNEVCIQISEEILGGKTYPEVPFVEDVRTIVDIGANIGAASVFLATTYPKATVFALEPSNGPFTLLQQNVLSLANVRAFPHGLFSVDKHLPLFQGRNDSVESSICPTGRTSEACETIALRSAPGFLAELGIGRIDILKLDTEGCEVPILRSLQKFTSQIKIIYVEYHSDRDRRLIDQLLAETHVLWRGSCSLVHRGEFCYLRRDLIPPETETHTCEILLPLEERSQD